MVVEKYSASGNDFVIFHTFTTKDRSHLARALCDRHNGIGADGLIVLIPHPTHNFAWEFYNADGSSAAMCGNGSRAAALYAFDHDLAPANMSFVTAAGVIHATVESNGVVESQLTPPTILATSFEEEGLVWWKIDTGVPHLVTVVDDLSVFDEAIAARMRHAHNANVNYVALQDGQLRVRTFERGVEAETLACGTGMAACFLRLLTEGHVGSEAKIIPKSGETLSMRSDNGTLYFKGAVQRLFTAVVPNERFA
ncbi:MAG: diaminopimelate epimerase [Campylobacterales bacterium]